MSEHTFVDSLGNKLLVGDIVSFAVGEDIKLPQLSTAKTATGTIVDFKKHAISGVLMAVVEHRYVKHVYSEDDITNPIIETNRTSLYLIDSSAITLLPSSSTR